MIICVCNCLNDREVHKAIAAGARRAKDVHACCGTDVSCGGCLSMMRDMIESAQAPETAQLQAVG